MKPDRACYVYAWMSSSNNDAPLQAHLVSRRLAATRLASDSRYSVPECEWVLREGSGDERVASEVIDLAGKTGLGLGACAAAVLDARRG